MTEFVKELKKEASLSKDAEIVKNLLPKHYKVTDQKDGVDCKSEIGVDDIKEEGFFDAFHFACKTIFDKRFMEIYHYTCHNHKDFAVFIRK
jgi:hypothetical protein